MLVVEDDACFDSTFQATWRSTVEPLIQRPNPNWDVMLLGFFGVQGDVAVVVDDVPVRRLGPGGHFFGTHGYVVTRHGAALLRDRAFPIVPGPTNPRSVRPGLRGSGGCLHVHPATTGPATPLPGFRSGGDSPVYGRHRNVHRSSFFEPDQRGSIRRPSMQVLPEHPWSPGHMCGLLLVVVAPDGAVRSRRGLVPDRQTNCSGIKKEREGFFYWVPRSSRPPQQSHAQDSEVHAERCAYTKFEVPDV